ncbi:sporulation regulator WhiA [Clostridium sulfidigenes]|uniref:Probable cell division protein WhiA n=1 Tax=Clostridium sulfidigenes TaxID=318464 RepID=A0A084JD24_9CLOT|nr:DNA-binding protein WhiA [Clostridium sulfidigenes]KEZ86858.1 sporulation regulator WhiA [Clostridium sulfidigenes]HAR85015.1 DNA-binding protein WhiA [Clostridium sp.]HBA03562.1 DNA-binding protein WhiA [Clostridium sp.]HCO74677.1 DNA-binding protein WhiA [Clostridium sp.]
MSFSLKVKNEVCRNSELSKDEIAAQLSAIMKSSGTLGFGFNRSITFKIVTENPAIARWIFKNLKDFYDIHTKLLVKKSNSLKKNNIYMVLIPEEVDVKGLLQELGIIEKDGLFNIHYGVPGEVIKNENCKRAYIKGAFLGGGSISNPEKTYHLEFVTHDQDYANELSDLINSYKLNSKVIQRKNSFVIYLKEGEQIVDLLNIIGAHNALLELENIRIMKEMRNNVNRIVNCETANLSKTVNAAVRQVESIKLIESEIGLDRLPKNLKEVAKLRLAFPDESLKELGAMLNPPVGKSGVNHRLRRIEKIADELRKEGR